MKKTMAICISIILVISIIPPGIYANNKEDYVTKEEAANIALIFISLNYSLDSFKWNESTQISKIIELYDIIGNTTAFYIAFNTDEKPSGYCVVSANPYAENAIIEFSDTETPEFSSLMDDSNLKIYYLNPFESYKEVGSDTVVSTKGEIVKKSSIIAKDQVILTNNAVSDKYNSVKKINPLISKLRNDSSYSLVIENNQVYLQSNSAQSSPINNPLSWLSTHYSSTGTWTNYDYGTLEPNIQAFTMSGFENNANNCSLTAITTILYYFQHSKGYTNIAASAYDIYYTLRNSASLYYGYTPESGTYFYVIDDLLEDSFYHYGYDNINASNNYTLLWDAITNDIDINENPLILSMNGGYYGSHSVTVVGWTQFTHSSLLGLYSFIKIYDGYVSSGRYLDYGMLPIIANVTRIIE